MIVPPVSPPPAGVVVTVMVWLPASVTLPVSALRAVTAVDGLTSRLSARAMSKPAAFSLIRLVRMPYARSEPPPAVTSTLSRPLGSENGSAERSLTLCSSAPCGGRS